MTALERAVVEVAGLLEAHAIDYMIVGGIANAVWGEPRATLDVDVAVAVENADLARTIEILEGSFRVAVSEPQEFVRQTRVLPLEGIRRAMPIQFGDQRVRVATAEDLVLMKIVSERPRDLSDAEAIIKRRASKLDRKYLQQRIRDLASALEQPEIWERWVRWSGEP